LTEIVKVENDWKDVKNVSRTTVNKSHTENEPTDSFKLNMLISQHSPIRLIKVRWLWKGIKSWVATHWSRHKFECFISTGRSDRTGIDRGTLSQDTLVNFDGEANAQHIIDFSKLRLCYEASKETREKCEDLKITLKNIEPELSYVMVPSCVYRGACPETFSSCKFWVILSNRMTREELLDIKERYGIYNEEFHK
jgi:hypothetical protein